MPGPILFRYPNAVSPTVTVTLNPANLVAYPQYIHTPFQQILVSSSGKVFVVKMADVVETLIDLNIEDLQEGTFLGCDGWDTLVAFFRTTTDYSVHPFDFTDPYAVTTYVRLWTRQLEFRDAEGRAQTRGRFSGSLRLRKEL